MATIKALHSAGAGGKKMMSTTRCHSRSRNPNPPSYVGNCTRTISMTNSSFTFDRRQELSVNHCLSMGKKTSSGLYFSSIASSSSDEEEDFSSFSIAELERMTVKSLQQREESSSSARAQALSEHLLDRMKQVSTDDKEDLSNIHTLLIDSWMKYQSSVMNDIRQHSLFRCPPSQEEGKSSSSCSSSEKQKTKEKETAKENNNSSSSESKSKSASNNRTGCNGCKDNNIKNNCSRNSNTSSTNGKYWSNDFTSNINRRHHNGGDNRIPPLSAPPACSANGGSGRSMDDSGECGRGNDEEINKEKKVPKDTTIHQVEESFLCTWFLQALFFIIMLPCLILIWACLHALIVHLIMSMSEKKMETKHDYNSKETNKPNSSSSSSSSYADTCNKSDDKPKTKSDNKEPKNNDGKTFVKSKKSLKKKKKTLPPVALKHHLSVFEMLDENGMINSDDELSLKALGKVHKKLRRKFHPDKNIGNEDIATKKFHRVDEAWHHLNKALEDKNRK